MTAEFAPICLLKPEEWERQRFSLLRFVRRHGQRRITSAAWRRLIAVDRAALAVPGTAIAVAYTPGGRPAGLVFATDHGESVCLAAVHPAFRARGIGRALLGVLARSWGRLSCRVAADNPASMAMCFAAGMVAVGFTCGPTGKATLLFRWRPGGEEATTTLRLGETPGMLPKPAPAFPAGR